jgi:hypothetical protein
MTSTQWRDDFRRVVKNRAVAYIPDNAGFKWGMPFENAYGAGGLLTTAGDLLLWNQALDEGRFGPDVTVQLEEQGRLSNGEKTGYGRGLFLGAYRGTKEVSHGGVTLGYVAFLGRFPEHKVSIAVLCNASSFNPSDLAHKVADRLLPQDLPVPQPAATANVRPAKLAAPTPARWAPSAAELEQISGSYQSDEALATYRAELEGGRLVLRLDGQPGEKHILSPTYRDTFVFLGGSIKFQRAANGAVSGMLLSASRVRDLAFKRQLPPGSTD